MQDSGNMFNLINILIYIMQHFFFKKQKKLYHGFKKRYFSFLTIPNPNIS